MFQSFHLFVFNIQVPDSPSWPLPDCSCRWWSLIHRCRPCDLLLADLNFLNLKILILHSFIFQIIPPLTTQNKQYKSANININIKNNNNKYNNFTPSRLLSSPFPFSEGVNIRPILFIKSMANVADPNTHNLLRVIFIVFGIQNTVSR